MPFPVTQYPLVGNHWIFPRTPSGGGPDHTGTPYQLYVEPHQALGYYYSAALGDPYNYPVWIKTPPGLINYKRQDVIEVSNGDALYYAVIFKENFYKGFPQWYEGLLCLQCTPARAFPRVY